MMAIVLSLYFVVAFLPGCMVTSVCESRVPQVGCRVLYLYPCYTAAKPAVVLDICGMHLQWELHFALFDPGVKKRFEQGNHHAHVEDPKTIRHTIQIICHKNVMVYKLFYPCLCNKAVYRNCKCMVRQFKMNIK